MIKLLLTIIFVYGWSCLSLLAQTGENIRVQEANGICIPVRTETTEKPATSRKVEQLNGTYPVTDSKRVVDLSKPLKPVAQNETPHFKGKIVHLDDTVSTKGNTRTFFEEKQLIPKQENNNHLKNTHRKAIKIREKP